MPATRFIFVEGIMGSGKTTTCAFIANELRRHGMPARVCLAAGNLSLDGASAACHIARYVHIQNALVRESTPMTTMSSLHDRNVDEVEIHRRRRARRLLISQQPMLHIGQTVYYSSQRPTYSDESVPLEYRAKVVRLYKENPERVGIVLQAKVPAVLSPPPEELLRPAPMRVVSRLALALKPYEQRSREAADVMGTLFGLLIRGTDDEE